MEWLDKEEAAGASSRLKREHMVRQKKLLSRPLIKQFLERVGDMEKVQVRPGCLRGAAITAARAVLATRASEQRLAPAVPGVCGTKSCRRGQGCERICCHCCTC